MGVIYAMRARTAAEMASDDPFSGHGIRLLCPEGVTPGKAARELWELLGEVPCVTWEACLWADGRELSPEQVSRLGRQWDEKMRARQNGARVHDIAGGAG